MVNFLQGICYRGYINLDLQETFCPGDIHLVSISQTTSLMSFLMANQFCYPRAQWEVNSRLNAQVKFQTNLRGIAPVRQSSCNASWLQWQILWQLEMQKPHLLATQTWSQNMQSIHAGNLNLGMTTLFELVHPSILTTQMRKTYRRRKTTPTSATRNSKNALKVQNFN